MEIKEEEGDQEKMKHNKMKIQMKQKKQEKAENQDTEEEKKTSEITEEVENMILEKRTNHRIRINI
jgi:hypothetical protein